MPTTPNWEAAENGLPGNLNATNHASQITQHLGTHKINSVYEGTQIVTTGGGTNFTWVSLGNATDVSQPFTMPGGQTTVGRVTVPVLVTGDGADLLVTLCPDSAGSPNLTAPIASTSIPASWLRNLGATDGLAAAGPLAVPRFNTYAMSGGITQVTWASPTTGINGPFSSASASVSGDYLISAGGYDPVTLNPVALVVTANHSGNGIMELPVAQPSLPQATVSGVLATTSTNVFYIGGQATAAVTSAVWSASWDPNTGVIGAWSTQTAYPFPVLYGSTATWNDTYIYVVSGYNGTTTTPTTAVYYNTINNGQLGTWVAGPPLPGPQLQAFTAVIGNWLVVVGGATVALGTPTTSVYYAKINSDGSLSSWLTGPSIPTAEFAFNPGWDIAVTDSGIVTVAGSLGPSTNVTANVMTLTVTANGLADQWYTTQWSHATAEQVGAFSNGDGSWNIIGLNYPNSYYESTTLVPVPLVSVPFAATGLTAGATYHVVLQQHDAASSSSYLSYGINTAALPTDALKSTRHSGTWSTYSAGYSMPMSVYNGTASGNLLHTWEDPSSTGSTYTSNLASRASTFVYDYRGLLVGSCSAAVRPNEPLNSNPTFTTGTSPWTAVGCTLTQSNAQTHGGYPFSGLMTPDGVTAAPYIESDRVPIVNSPTVLGNVTYYMVNGWLYSPTGLTQVSLSVNWFDRNLNFLANTFTGVSLPAATWTNVVSYNLAPSGAAYAAINPTITGTPGVGNTLYLSNVTLTSSIELTSTQASVASISYGGTAWPPTGVTTLT